MPKPESKQRRYPEEGELVLGTVTKVFPYGAFVRLEEYKGLDGMIHISEISSKWIKNIRDYVKEDQKVVVKVLKMDREKGHIDLSLKSVKAVQNKQKTEEYKLEQKARKLVELAGNKLKDVKSAGKVISALEEKHGSVYSALEECVEGGEAGLKDAGIEPKWAKALAEVAKENIELPFVEVRANLELTTKAPNGVAIIRDILLDAKKKHSTEEVEVSIKYISAPTYRIELRGEDYKTVEKVLSNITDDVISRISSSEGEGKVIRLQK